MPRMMILTLLVEDLAAAVRFYEAIGCRRASERGDRIQMTWSDSISFALTTPIPYALSLPAQLVRTEKPGKVRMTLSLDRRDELDPIVAAAVGAGGRADIAMPLDVPYLYSRTIADPDGHMYELVWMEPDSAAEAVDKFFQEPG